MAGVPATATSGRAARDPAARAHADAVGPVVALHDHPQGGPQAVEQVAVGLERQRPRGEQPQGELDGFVDVAAPDEQRLVERVDLDVDEAGPGEQRRDAVGARRAEGPGTSGGGSGGSGATAVAACRGSVIRVLRQRAPAHEAEPTAAAQRPSEVGEGGGRLVEERDAQAGVHDVVRLGLERVPTGVALHELDRRPAGGLAGGRSPAPRRGRRCSCRSPVPGRSVRRAAPGRRWWCRPAADVEGWSPGRGTTRLMTASPSGPSMASRAGRKAIHGSAWTRYAGAARSSSPMPGTGRSSGTRPSGGRGGTRGLRRAPSPPATARPARGPGRRSPSPRGGARG